MLSSGGSHVRGQRYALALADEGAKESDACLSMSRAAGGDELPRSHALTLESCGVVKALSVCWLSSQLFLGQLRSAIRQRRVT